MSPNNSQNNSPLGTGHGFGLGLLVGGIAGIASYYLLGTKEGQKLKTKLVEEFEYAQIKIPQEIAQIIAEADNPAIPPTQRNNSEAVQGFLAQLKTTLKPSKQPTSKQSSNTPKKTRQFFRKSDKK